MSDFHNKLEAAAVDCFTCPAEACVPDPSPVYIRDQFLRGLNNETLQADLLTKTTTLKSIDNILKHAKAYEAAIRDQVNLQGSSKDAFNNNDTSTANVMAVNPKQRAFNKNNATNWRKKQKQWPSSE